MLSPLSLGVVGAGGGAGFFAPTAGRFAGGAGGVGFALITPDRAVPLLCGGCGTVRMAMGGGSGRVALGGGAAGSSLRYAAGVQPSSVEASRLASHHPINHGLCQGKSK